MGVLCYARAAVYGDAEPDNDVVDAVDALCSKPGVVVTFGNQYSELLEVVRRNEGFRLDSGQITEGQLFGINGVGLLFCCPGKHRVYDGRDAAPTL